MNENINNFIENEAKSIEEIKAEIEKAEQEAKALQAELDAIAELLKPEQEVITPKRKAKIRTSSTTKLYATPQYDFLDDEAKSNLEALSNWEIKDEWRDVSTADMIAIDTETYDPDLKTAGSSWARGTGHLLGVSIAAIWGDEIWSNYYPINHPHTNNFEVEKVTEYITKCLTSCKGPRVFANAEYDIGWLNRYGVPLAAFLEHGPIDDVLAMAVLVDETWLSYSLENVVSFYCDEHKDESLLQNEAIRRAYGIQNPKSDMWKLPAKFVGPYAEQDAVVTIKAYKELVKLIDAHPLTGKSLWKVYDVERRLIPMLFEIHKRGVKVDLDRATQIKDELKEQQLKIKKYLNSMAGFEVNPMSGADLGRACDNLGIAYARTAKTGTPSFTADFLENSDSEFLQAVRDIRKISKVESTFVDTVLDKAINGRIYPQLNALKRTEDKSEGSSGTITGRFSCTKPNLQQVSSRDKVLAPIVRSMFLPDEGYLWGNFDYSQQEPRMTIHIAYLLSKIGVTGLSKVHEAVARFNENPRTDNHHSALTGIVTDTYKKLFGKEPKVIGIHAGLECGLFSEKYPGLDMVSMGPTLRGVHSPDERLLIPTVQMVWDHLLEIMKNIPTRK